MKVLKALLLIGFAAGALAALFVYAGVFDVAADVPHSAIVYAGMEAVRDRSIAVRAKDIQVPPLDDPKLIAEGAEHYDAMCIGCHLAPGFKQSELRDGLYPQPPDMTEHIDAGTAEMFWVIKHGIKMSAMPAWGKTHDDQSIWALVAFLQKLPELTRDQYEALVAAGGEDHDFHRHREKAAGLRGEGTRHDHHHDAASRQEPRR
jgi:mono/diheme cytochrome c family protein